MHIQSLSLSPDPITLPGNITVSVGATLVSVLNAPIKAEVTLQKKAGVWIKIPCIGTRAQTLLGSIFWRVSCSPCLPFFRQHWQLHVR